MVVVTGEILRNLKAGDEIKIRTQWTTIQEVTQGRYKVMLAEGETGSRLHRVSPLEIQDVRVANKKSTTRDLVREFATEHLLPFYQSGEISEVRVTELMTLVNRFGLGITMAAILEMERAKGNMPGMLGGQPLPYLRRVCSSLYAGIPK